ncbi:unnamed protein product [Calypogeia fissa]
MIMAGRLVSGSLYNLNSGNAQVGNTLHDLNTVASRNGDLEGIAEVDRDAPAGDSLDQEEDSNSGSYGNSLALQVVSGPETDHSMIQEGDDPPGSPYGVLSLNDVIPIETARARFLQIIIDHFIRYYVVPTPESPPDMNFNSPNSKEKMKKRRSRDVAYEGDANYLLPLTFVANLYETLIHEVNQRLVTVEGIHEKTMGVALEAAGGLYRRLVKKYPKSGSPTTFKRREMASALEARTKFPQLVTGDEKRVRFVVVHGLELVERPDSLPPEDAEWFKRLTGRHEAAISPRDYNFFSPRVKHRRPPQLSLSNVSILPPYPTVDASQGMPPSIRVGPQFPVQDSGSMATRSPPLHAQQSQQQQSHQQHQSHSSSHLLAPPHTSHGQHTPTHPSHSVHGPLTPHGPHTQHPPHTPPHIQSSVLHPSGGSMILISMPSNAPAKFCDECGAQYLRETSKFCSECGAKRLDRHASV